jgi:hypothetical protein
MEELEAAIGSPTGVKDLDNLILEYAYMDRRAAVRLLVAERPVYKIYASDTPTYVALSPLVHDVYDIIIQLHHMHDFPYPPGYVIKYDELAEMSTDGMPDSWESIDLSESKTIVDILGFELGLGGSASGCSKLIEMIIQDIDSVLETGRPVDRPIGIPWPPTMAGLSKDARHSGRF